MGRIKAFILSLLLLFSAGYSATPPCINPISTVDWSFFVDAFEFKGTCTCSTSGTLKVGVKLQLAEPIAFIETPQKAWDFLCLGSTRSKFSLQKKDGNNIGRESSDGAKTNAHYIKYPVFAVLNIVMDNLCVTRAESFDLIPTGLSEINPLIWDDELSILIQPWKLLLATPVTQVLCLADCIASTSVTAGNVGFMESVRNNLFWCAGCWGTITPDTTTTSGGADTVVESALTATKLIDILHETLQLKVFKETSNLSWAGAFSNWGTPSDVACNPKFFPIIVKSQYWLNLSYPVAWDAVPIGKFAPLWSWFKKYPTKEENVFTLWRIRTCCLGFQFP